jgi:hypothetical protein
MRRVLLADVDPIEVSDRRIAQCVNHVLVFRIELCGRLSRICVPSAHDQAAPLMLWHKDLKVQRIPFPAATVRLRLPLLPVLRVASGCLDHFVHFRLILGQAAHVRNRFPLFIDFQTWEGVRIGAHCGGGASAECHVVTSSYPGPHSTMRPAGKKSDEKRDK